MHFFLICIPPPIADRDYSLEEVCYKVCVCNAVRDALEGEVLSVRFQQLLLRPSKRMVDFILEVLLSHLFLCPKKKDHLSF